MPFEDREGRMCGFLNIEETENTGTFCRRYFVLDQNNGKLVYFMDSPANLPEAWRSPVGEIFIHNISKVSDGSQQRPKVQFCFTITVTGRTYCLQAETEEGKQSWTQAITNASKITVPEKASPHSQVEWHAGDITQGGYITEIAGGVVCKLPIQAAESEGVSDEEESRSSSSSTPPSSFSRGSVHAYRDWDPQREAARPGADQKLQPIRAGFCVKQGGVRKNWLRRYFALHERGLSYFKSEHDKQPLRTIALDDITHVQQSTDGSHPGRDNLFEVITTKRTFYVQCDTPADMFGWIHALEQTLQQKYTFRHSQVSQGPRGQQPAGNNDNYPNKVWL
ncbi:pleckstrin homology domain-containing family A member 1 [Aplysia californica]|uniref:Pleckstrin homology domain-containing family A member 1 n=1 Tax=Aplysia californica TaxID=6500 RepID=A0ABM0JA58_APLCA|nr:pleckstrin homology domain-containing family A member 1 [Aplysia californica]